MLWEHRGIAKGGGGGGGGHTVCHGVHDPPPM